MSLSLLIGVVFTFFFLFHPVNAVHSRHKGTAKRLGGSKKRLGSSSTQSPALNAKPDNPQVNLLAKLALEAVAPAPDPAPASPEIILPPSLPPDIRELALKLKASEGEQPPSVPPEEPPKPPSDAKKNPQVLSEVSRIALVAAKEAVDESLGLKQQLTPPVPVVSPPGHDKPIDFISGSEDVVDDVGLVSKPPAEVVKTPPELLKTVTPPESLKIPPESLTPALVKTPSDDANLAVGTEEVEIAPVSVTQPQAKDLPVAQPTPAPLTVEVSTPTPVSAPSPVSIQEVKAVESPPKTTVVPSVEPIQPAKMQSLIRKQPLPGHEQLKKVSEALEDGKQTKAIVTGLKDSPPKPLPVAKPDSIDLKEKPGAGVVAEKKVEAEIELDLSSNPLKVSSGVLSQTNADNCTGSETFALTNFSDYRGCQFSTVGKRLCQKWSVQTPHTHSFLPANYGSSGIGIHNYCRNPEGSGRGKLWCYTTDPRIPIEDCNPWPDATCTHESDSHGESLGPSGSGYRGCNSWTKSGKSCKRWDQSSYSTNISTLTGRGLGAHNFCRSPMSTSSQPESGTNGEMWCFRAGITR